MNNSTSYIYLQWNTPSLEINQMSTCRLHCKPRDLHDVTTDNKTSKSQTPLKV